jgi:hypothetical protein
MKPPCQGGSANGRIQEFSRHHQFCLGSRFDGQRVLSISVEIQFQRPVLCQVAFSGLIDNLLGIELLVLLIYINYECANVPPILGWVRMVLRRVRGTNTKLADERCVYMGIELKARAQRDSV